MKIHELIDLVSEVEMKKLQNYSKKKGHYDIAPVGTAGSPIEDDTARPTIILDILDDEVAIKWIYLNVQNKGLGTKIIQWLITYCRQNNIKRISIRLVDEGNDNMIYLAEKLGFKVIGKRNTSLDYGLFLKDD